MSNDHIFASQMWAWPDPMIKRDSHGRILVVNAAFLQLYGGTIESWTGNPIDGWPAPKSPGEVSRFESRIPMPTGGETVYDWMECTHQDGTAVAMARDVSVYAAKKQVQPDAFIAEPVAETPAAAEPVAVAADPAPAEIAAQSAQIKDDLAAMSPVNKINTVPEVAVATSAIAAAATVTQVQEPIENVISEVVTPPAPTLEVTPEIPVTQPVAHSVPTTPVQEPQESTRAMEKRALPIEDGDAILGNNWRDAVIAKAVGVEDTTEDNTEAEATDAPAPALSTPSGDQIKVLLAEDNAINALLTRTLLEAEGCQCDVVEDGVLAVEAVKNNDYHLVFMDMRMPNMDGLEATRKIRSIGYNAKVLPIVALTANAFDDDRNACFDSGMNDFMTKPVSAEELSAMVKTHTSLEAEKIAS